MAYAYPTMLDIAKINGSDQSIGLIEENLNAAPEIAILPARTITGTSYKALIRTAYPAGSFRQVNGSTPPTKSTYVNKLFETFYYDTQMEADRAAVSGCDRGLDYVLAMEADGHARAYLLKTGSQFWYGSGSGGDANGYPGASQFVDTSLKTDATGTTALTGSSVYFIVANPKSFGLIFGNNTVLAPGAWRMQTITRTVNNVAGELTAWKNSLEGWIGVEFLSKYSVGQIYNLTEDGGKGLTDVLLAKERAKFPIGVEPTHIFMSRRSRRQLQLSRTVTLFGQGSGRPSQPTIAPVPTEYDGIPIVATDSITDVEAIV